MRLTRMGFLTALIVIAALWLGSLVTSLLPDPQAVYEAPFVSTGGIGDTVTTRTVDVTVTGVRAGPEVFNGLDVATTTGAWLVVDLTWTAHEETTALNTLEARIQSPDGRTFGVLLPASRGCGQSQPGVAVSCSLPFEVAPDALEGAHLLIPNSTVTSMDDVADIDLGLDAEAAAALAASTTRQTLPEATPAVG